MFEEVSIQRTANVFNEDHNNREIFLENGSILIKDVVSKELAQFFTHTLLRVNHSQQIDRNLSFKDPQVPGALVSLNSNPFFDTFHEKLWPVAEKVLGEELLPTYCYSRLYCNDNVLTPHKDRPSCEISLTVQMGRSHNYSWPIYTEGTEYVLDEGDAMMYLGCDKTHWRNKCEGPDGYYSGQLFVHYVRANGKHSHLIGDKRWPTKNIPYVRNRIEQMQTKNK